MAGVSNNKSFTIMDTTQFKEENRAREQAAVQLASIQELVTCLAHAKECDDTACGANCPHDEDTAREAIIDDVLSVEVRTDWHTVGAVEACKPTDYKILLCWGGPAVQIVGTLDAYNQPDSAKLQYQDWFTTWLDYPLTKAEVETVVKYARQFSFDE
jgi:hypothetical protein